MLCTLLAAVILFSSLYQEGDAVYSIYQVQKMKRKVFKMCIDLIFDAKSKIQHAQFLRKSYEQFEDYAYGNLMYDIRRHYTRLLYIHNLMVTRINKPFQRYRETNTSVYEWYMLEAVHTGSEIDKLVEIMELEEFDGFPFRKEIIETVITTTEPPKTVKKLNKWGGRLLRANKHGFFRHGRSLKRNRNNWKGDLDGLTFDSDKD